MFKAMASWPRTKMKNGIKKSDLQAGRWVRVMWDDVGATDCVIVDPCDGSDDLRVFAPTDSMTQRVTVDQIVAIGKFISAKDSGL